MKTAKKSVTVFKYQGTSTVFTDEGVWERAPGGTWELVGRWRPAQILRSEKGVTIRCLRSGDLGPAEEALIGEAGPERFLAIEDGWVVPAGQFLRKDGQATG